VTTLEQKNPAKRGLFSIYKPGQGKYVRWGTVGGMAIIVFAGAWWLNSSVLAAYDLPIKAGAMVAWIAIFALLTFWIVNKPNLAEFMIMTESEMRKVAWPTRRQVYTSTRVVIFLTLVLAGILYLVDEAFMYLFGWLKIL
jgi:preprotein translocase SecE subunit